MSGPHAPEDIKQARKLLARLRGAPAASLAMVDRLRRLPPARRRAILSGFSAVQLAALMWEWRRFWARPDQIVPPKPWTFCLFKGGRGSGKTRSCAERIRERVRTRKAKRVHLIAATPAAAEEVMINGPSGIRTISPPEERPRFLPSKGLAGVLEWPNGVRGLVFSAESPQHLRGPACSDLWCDDIANWGPGAEEAWKQAMHGLRVLPDIECLISTTPIALPLVVSLIQDKRRGMVIRESITDDNQQNLARALFDDVLTEFEGTALEEQERYGKLLVDIVGSLFKKHWIEPHRIDKLPELKRVVVAVDPPDAETERSDECGIVVQGVDERDELHVLADLTGPHTAAAWARLTVEAYREYKADCVVVEANRGRGLIRRNLAIEAANLPIKEVTATRGKATRAEPLSHLYQKGRVHHWKRGPGLTSRLHRRPREKSKRPETLEEEMCSWVPGKGRSPNGVDALVWGATELLPLEGHWSAVPAQGPVDEVPPDPFRYTQTSPDEHHYTGSADDYG